MKTKEDGEDREDRSRVERGREEVAVLQTKGSKSERSKIEKSHASARLTLDHHAKFLRRMTYSAKNPTGRHTIG